MNQLLSMVDHDYGSNPRLSFSKHKLRFEARKAIDKLHTQCIGGGKVVDKVDLELASRALTQIHAISPDDLLGEYKTKVSEISKANNKLIAELCDEDGLDEEVSFYN